MVVFMGMTVTKTAMNVERINCSWIMFNFIKEFAIGSTKYGRPKHTTTAIH